ncbi:MAG: DUF3857 domain-containing protein [Nibricoccus sp.]
MRLQNLFPALVVSLSLAAAGYAASSPDWLQPLLAEDITGWKESHAVIRLLDYEKVDFLSEDRTRSVVRGAVRVTTEAGKVKRYIDLVYNADTEKVRGAKAWIISADGKKVRSYRQVDFRDAIATYSTHFWDSSRLIFFDSRDVLEIGGVVAWEIEVERKASIFDSSHMFLNEEPTLCNIFEVTPYTGGKLEWFGTSSRLPAPVPGAAAGSMRWEVRRAEALPAELPSGFYPDPMRVSVRCLGPQKSSNEFKTWDELACLTGAIIEPKILATPELKTQAESITAGRSTRWERIRALTEFIQKEITYLAVTQDKDSLAGYRPHAAGEVLQNRFGDCKDKATVLAAMLRSIGENGYVVLVFSGNPRVVPSDWPSACFNHAIIAIPADNGTPESWPVVDGAELGKLVLFDPTNPFIPLGVLPHNDQSGFCLIAHDKGRLVRVQNEEPKFNGVRRKINAAVDDKGAVSVSAEEIYFGLQGATQHVLREELDTGEFGSRLKRHLLSLFPLAQSFKWENRWDSSTATFAITSSFKLEKFLRDIGKGRLLVSPKTTPDPARLQPWKTTFEGVAWTTAESCQDEICLVLPPGFSVVELPDEWRTENSLLSCRIRYRIEGDRVVMTRESQLKAGFLQKSEYDALRTQLIKIQDALNRPITLQCSSVEKTSTTPAPKP